MADIARVDQIDYERGMVKVTLTEREIESNWIALPSLEYDPPKIGDLVRVAFDGDNFTAGQCLGRYYNAENLPVVSGETVCYKKFGEDLVFYYDKEAKVLEITATAVRIVGDLSISGGLSVSGDVSAGGSISAGGAITAPSIVEGGGAG